MNLQAVFLERSLQSVQSRAQASFLSASTLRKIGFCPALLSLLVFSFSCFAQAPKPSAPVGASVSGKVVTSGPSWSELTPMQQHALAPLALTWNTGISETQKRKWLEISRNFNALSHEDQATLNSRMNDWVSLSPQQRAQARLNFGKTKELSKQLTAEEKKAKWDAYQALSPEEKEKLAAKGRKPTGAATAIKPVAPQKLATLPVQAASKPMAKPASKIMPSPPATVTSPAAPPVSVPAGIGTNAAPQR